MSLSNHRLVAASENNRQAARGAALLQDVLAHVKRFCALPDQHSYVAVVLWIALAHMAEHFHTLPRLAALSAEPGSGKSRLLEIIRDLVPEPMFVFGASVAALFRTMAERSVTLLFDECDTIFTRRGKDDQNEDLRALLNVGYRNGATIPRCVGPQHSVEHFNVFGPAALAGLGDLPQTIIDRSIVIRMRRRAPTEYVEPYRTRLHEHEGNAIRDQLVEWSAAVGPAAGESWPDLPDGIVDRLAEIWEPLIAIADAAGGDWPEDARQAATHFAELANDRSPSLGIRLLTDLKTVFDGRGAMWTTDILRALCDMDEAPWSNLQGEGLDSRGLAFRLGQYDAKPKDIRIGTEVRRGYSAADLYDAWQRYCPSDPRKSTTSATPATDPVDIDSDCSGPVADVATSATDPLHEKPATTEPVAPVADVVDYSTPEGGMPARSEIFALCKEACEGTGVDPSRLCQDLIDAGDPEHCTPKAIAKLVAMRQGGAA